MAQKVQTPVIEDITAAPPTGRPASGPDGTEYEIDLTAGHARRLGAGLAAYVRAGRRASGGSRRAARGGRTGPASGADSTQVGEWAKAQGIEVKDRGRVPAELAVKFTAATGHRSSRDS